LVLDTGSKIQHRCRGHTRQHKKKLLLLGIPTILNMSGFLLHILLAIFSVFQFITVMHYRPGIQAWM